eukprot:1497576-Pyramimonas_sp.AAC.1
MEDPGLTPGAAVDPLELAQAKYSAFCGGRLVSTLLSDMDGMRSYRRTWDFFFTMPLARQGTHTHGQM